jgi:hypothetical protein
MTHACTRTHAHAHNLLIGNNTIQYKLLDKCYTTQSISIIRHFGFSRYVAFAMHIDIHYV